MPEVADAPTVRSGSASHGTLLRLHNGLDKVIINNMKKLLILLIIFVILCSVFILGYLGLIPGLSTLLGADKPRDLGIKYTQADLKSCRSKSRVEYTSLPDSSSPSQTRQVSGQREVAAEFTSAEITATMNNQPWRFWPYQNVQVKFNADGSGEISGVLIKDRIPGYAATIGIPKEAADFAMKFLPANPVFYVKMKADLTDNKVSLFEPQALQIGRLPMPLSLFLSLKRPQLIDVALAQNLGEMSQELSKVQNKKALIIGYINSRLSSAFGNFYAKKAYAGENKLFFEGTLPEKISYSP